jgi:thiamine-monophosphate kinase
MIDVSDGLLQDLGHICRASDVGAAIWEASLPLSRSYRMLAGEEGSRWALSGGEDYELLFCARRQKRPQVQALAKRTGMPMSRIGVCVAKGQGITVIDRNGRKVTLPNGGHDHFRQALRGRAN